MQTIAKMPRKTPVLRVAFMFILFESARSDYCSKFSEPDETKMEFYSPDYPYYPPNMDCVLRLAAPENFQIQLHFIYFEMERCDFCNCDWVDFRSGNYSSSPRIYYKCGTSLAGNTAVYGRFLFIQFRSDYGGFYLGFRVKYKFISSEQKTARDRVVIWLLMERTPSWGWNGDTARALVALRLSGNYNGVSQEDQLMAKQAQLRTAVDLARSVLPAVELSFHLHVLLATCSNPRNFYGYDLVRRLKEQVESSPNVSHPLAYLALCNAREAWPAKAYDDIEEIFGSDSELFFFTDIQSVAVLAVSCMADSNEGFWDEHNSTLASLHNATVKRLKQMQLADGSFGTLYSTAAITQALISSGEMETGSRDWAAAMSYMMKETNSPSLDFLSAYLSLPLFNFKTLADIRNINCTSNITKKEKRDFIWKEVSDYRGPTVRVRYSLFVGDHRDVMHSIALRVPLNSTAYQLMEMAQAENPKYRFSWKTISGVKRIYQVAQMPNDHETGKFWLLHLVSENVTEPYAHFNADPDKLSVHEGDHLVMWYKTLHL